MIKLLLKGLGVLVWSAIIVTVCEIVLIKYHERRWNNND